MQSNSPYIIKPRAPSNEGHKNSDLFSNCYLNYEKKRLKAIMKKKGSALAEIKNRKIQTPTKYKPFDEDEIIFENNNLKSQLNKIKKDIKILKSEILKKENEINKKNKLLNDVLGLKGTNKISTYNNISVSNVDANNLLDLRKTTAKNQEVIDEIKNDQLKFQSELQEKNIESNMVYKLKKEFCDLKQIYNNNKKELEELKKNASNTRIHPSIKENAEIIKVFNKLKKKFSVVSEENIRNKIKMKHYLELEDLISKKNFIILQLQETLKNASNEKFEAENYLEALKVELSDWNENNGIIEDKINSMKEIKKSEELEAKRKVERENERKQERVKELERAREAKEKNEKYEQNRLNKIKEINEQLTQTNK